MSGLILPYRNHLPRLGQDVFIAATATVIGDVEIGDRSSLWYSVVVRGDVQKIRIGADTNLQDGTIVHVTDPIYDTLIGDGVIVGHNAVIHACTLEDGSFVGMSATVMDEAVVETNAMVAAGAVVTPRTRVKSGELWAGCPAKPLRDLTAEELAYIPELAQHYVDLAAEYLKAG